MLNANFGQLLAFLLGYVFLNSSFSDYEIIEDLCHPVTPAGINYYFCIRINTYFIKEIC